MPLVDIRSGYLDVQFQMSRTTSTYVDAFQVFHSILTQAKTLLAVNVTTELRDLYRYG